jgi:hypothetical protein
MDRTYSLRLSRFSSSRWILSGTVPLEALLMVVYPVPSIPFYFPTAEILVSIVIRLHSVLDDYDP